MDKLINNFRSRDGIWGVVAVTGLAAGAVLFASGQGRRGVTPHGPTPAVQTIEHRDNASGPSGVALVHEVIKPPVAIKGDCVEGERRYLLSCAACHGPEAMGQPHLGANLRDSRFVREQTDEALVAFVKAGRPLGDPKSVLGLSMPPLGGSPTLNEGQIRDIVAFLRTVQATLPGASADTN